MLRKNSEIINSMISICSNLLDKSLFSFENVYSGRNKLSTKSSNLYYLLAGDVLQLSEGGDDLSSSPKLENQALASVFKEERKVLSRYLASIAVSELKDKHEQALAECIEMLKNSTRTFNTEFLSVVYLIILFDSEEESVYHALCKPLARFCTSILYNEYLKEESK